MKQGFLLLELLTALLLLSMVTLIVTSYHNIMLRSNQEMVVRCALINKVHSALEQMRITENNPEKIDEATMEISFLPLAQPDYISWIKEYDQEAVRVIDVRAQCADAAHKNYSLQVMTVKV